MSTIRRVTASIAALGVGMLATGGALLASPATAQADPASDATPGNLLLMLDASGSMKAKDPSGLTKMAAAKKALTSVVGALPTDAQVGLRVYGATQPGVAPGVKPGQAACTDTQLVAPITTLDKPGLTKAINGFAAKGETPISYSLTQALKDLGPTGKRNIVLVSDGEESCVPDPCPVVKKLVGNGIDLQIDTVGFGVNAKARKQLQCLADTGKGTYYDAKNADQLTASLTKLSTRATRPFTVSGTPVKATLAPEEAPSLKPGQYTDSFTTGQADRYYKITRAAGATTLFSVTARPGPNSDDYNTERLNVSIGLPDGTDCQGESGSRFANRGSIVTAVRVRGPEDAQDDDACNKATELVVRVSRPQGAAGPVPVEVLLVEEPEVRNASSLPKGLDPDAVKPLIAPAQGAGTPVTGGGSFSDALTLTPGTYSDVILPDEQIFYRVRGDFGQRLAFTVDAPAPGTTLKLGSTSYTAFNVNAWNPWRYPITRAGGSPSNGDSLGPSGKPIVLGEYTPEIRYNNRDSYGNGRYSWVPLSRVNVAGYYYFAVGRSAEEAGEDSAAPVPVRIRVAVEGQPTGTPEYAGAAPGVETVPPSSAPSSGPSGSTTVSSSTTVDSMAASQRSASGGAVPVWVWIVGGVVALAAAGAIALGATRRGSNAGSHQ